MRRSSLALVVSLLIASPLSAQSGLRGRIIDLFRFGGGCPDPVCLSLGTGHGRHFIPAALEGGSNLIVFLGEAIGVAASNIPLAAASGGAIWEQSAQGLPVRTTTSAGPIFAERAETLGRGRWLLAANVHRADFRSLRGVPLDGLQFTFTHQDTNADGLGSPIFEGDVIDVRTNVDLSVTAFTPMISYGLTRHIDVSVALPLIRTSLAGTSIAEVNPYAQPTPHIFGSPENPSLLATAAIDGTAAGIGDLAVRLKASVLARPGGGIALLADLRLPTGREEDLLGAGESSLSIAGIASLRRGAFSPHLNLGYLHRAGEFRNDALLATAGFDHLLAPGATLALDLITGWQLGSSGLQFTEAIPVNAPVGSGVAQRIIRPTNVPNLRDDLVMGSVGAKLGVGRDVNLVSNAVVPLRHGGLQPGVAWTVGVEYAF